MQPVRGTVAALAAFVAFAAGAHAGGVSRVEGADLGPSLESVTAVFEDRAGFLWIGSREGLALYDGYASIVFEHDVSDPSSISDNTIRAVYEDSHGSIWVGTNTGGLERLDRSTWVFAHHRHDSSDPQSLPHDSVYAIVEDRDGRLWVGTQGGLARLDPRSDRFERFPAGTDGPGSDYIVALRLEPDGTLWVATANGGLSRRDPSTGAFRTFRHDPGDPSSLAGDGVYAIAEDARGRLWLATDSGPCWFDRTTRAFHAVPLAGYAGRGPPLTTAIVAGAGATVWACTLDSGLWRLDPEAGVFRRHAFRTARSVDSRSRIVYATVDRAGNLWLGTWSEGLGRVTPRSRVFLHSSETGPPVEIASVLRDGRGRLWIGFLDTDLELRTPGVPPRRVPLGSIPLRIVEAEDGAWIGTSSGLLRFDVRSATTRRYAHDPRDPRSLGAGWVWAIHRDGTGALWVGTGEGGLYRLRHDGTFERFAHDPADPESLSDDYVTVIEEDRAGLIWVGTRSGGLNAFDRTTSRFRRFLPDPRDEHSLSHHSVSAILVDRAGTLWVGTAGGGLDRARTDANGRVEGFDRFTERDGLVDDNVVSLLEDDDGSLWVGTRRGLSRLDPVSRRVVSYGTEDGLASVELTPGAATAGPDALYFGTHRGIVAVRRGTPFPDSRASPTVVTAIRTIGGPGTRERLVPAGVDVEIPWGRILSLEFSVLDFGDPRRHRYAYRISGRHEGWVNLGQRREITFTDLEPGRYDLAVRGRNDRGVWSESARPIRIRVVPPFWMTFWFRLAVAGVVAALAIGGHRLRTASLERRNRELVRLKEQREGALEEARRSGSALNDAFARLRRLTRRLEAAKEEERKRIARELHDEMGQALTTAKLNLQLCSGLPDAGERARRIADTIGLLDRMIGHVRALSLDLRPPLLDELGLSAALRGYLEAQARRAGIAIDVEIDPVPTGVSTDAEIAAFRVVQEAITNVVRHAAAGRVEVEVRYDPADGIELRVADDGRGFDVPTVLEPASLGNHVGLLGMRERVESMGGRVSIVSAPGAGTEVRASLPLRS